ERRAVGNGSIDVFDRDGNWISVFASQGTLSARWGLALAHADFGKFSNDVVAGNFGDGRINAFDPVTGTFLGQLQDGNGNAIAINGLWGLAFENGGLAGDTNTLFFAAGFDDEEHGLFHAIAPAERGSSHDDNMPPWTVKCVRAEGERSSSTALHVIIPRPMRSPQKRTYSARGLAPRSASNHKRSQENFFT